MQAHAHQYDGWGVASNLLNSKFENMFAKWKLFFADMYRWCFSNWFDGIGNDGVRSGVYDHEHKEWR